MCFFYSIIRYILSCVFPTAKIQSGGFVAKEAVGLSKNMALFIVTWTLGIVGELFVDSSCLRTSWKDPQYNECGSDKSNSIPDTFKMSKFHVNLLIYL